MTINIIDEPDINLTSEQYQKYRYEYQQSIMMMVNPPSFEGFVRSRMKERNKK